MGKKLSVFGALFCVLATFCLAQITPSGTMNGVSTFRGYDYGNDWYVNNQPWFKMMVWEDGVYRVSRTDLVQASVNLNGLDPDNLHVIYRGEEVPVYLQKDGAGNLDFFEFYGRINDGAVDSSLYKDPYSHLPDPEQQPNEFYSLFTDTSAYFVTWNNTPGLRIEGTTSQNFAAHTPEPHFRYQALNSVAVDYFRGGGSDNNSFFVLNSDYITGQGYIGFKVEDGDRRQSRLETPYWANSGNPNKVQIRSMGVNSEQHYLQVAVWSTNNIVYQDTFFGISMARHAFLDSTVLPAATRVYFWALQPNPAQSNKMRINWVSIDYDRLFNAGGDDFLKIHEWQDTDTARFSFSNVSATSEAWVYDLTSRKRISGVVNGSSAEFLIPGDARNRKLVLATDNAVRSPLIKATTSLTNLSNTQNNANYIIISHKKLRNSAEKYKQYRDTASVTPVNARVVYIDEIYDEFGYGSPTPLAIKRFCKYALDRWSTTPEMFFLWGKGMYRTRGQVQNLVPTWGYPATDQEFVSNFNPKRPSYYLEASIGRVNVENDQEGFAYLQKVNEYEHIPYKSWMKEGVFLGGGKTFSEQSAIINALVDNYMATMETSEAAGNGNYYVKKGNGSLTNVPITSEERINRGAGIIHFFGHSSTNTFDVDIQDASLYANNGKYPFMIAAGCYGGDFTESIKSFGERFVLEPGKGSIGYLGNSTAGFLAQLSQFGRDFYDEAFVDSYGEPLGDIIQETIKEYLTSSNGQPTTSILLINQARQMNLQGDPGLVMRFPKKPDLKIQPTDVLFEPATLSAQDDEFGMRIVMENQGASFVDSFNIRIRQRSPLGTEIEFPIIRRAPVRKYDTLSVTLPNNFGNQFAGLNEFEIFVDASDSLDEYFEDNNLIIKRQLIQSNTPAILFPPEFAVVPDAQIKLSASTYVMTTQTDLPFEFQIDTSESFNSPALRTSGPVIGTAPFVEWSLPFSLTEGQVYYWRVRLTETNPPAWTTSSFKYAAGKSGWAQARMPQFTKDQILNLNLDKLNWEWAFDLLTRELNVNISAAGVPNYFFGPYGSNLSTPPPGVLYTTIDHNTLEVNMQGGQYADWKFALTPQALPDLVSAIYNTSPDDYFMMASFGNPRIGDWDDATLRAFESIGCDFAQLRAIPNGKYIIVLGKKGSIPGSAQVISEPNRFLQNGARVWEIRTDLSAPYSTGQIISTDIGPATDWRDISLSWTSLDEIPEEDVSVTVIGLRDNNLSDTLLRDVQLGTTLLNTIDASVYPNLRLLGRLTDDKQFTAPQMSEWEVIYGIAPDALIDPVTNATLPVDTISEGEIVSLNVQARNVTPTNMDSLLVRFSIERADRSVLILDERRYAPLPGNAAIDIPFEFPSGGKRLVDNVRLIIELNPNNDQVEQYFFNNTFQKSLFVLTDKVGPILDVTFDGKHLMDGDIVSPTPEIQIQIADDNNYLPIAISDSTYKIWFGRGRATNLLPSIPIEGNANIESVPGKMNSSNNKSQLIFRPGLLNDGEYSLMVQGYDAKGNASGSKEYIIHFNVVNEKAVSQVMNYPNPFSSSTKFVYTLTGNELPYRFDIQIYTITGKLIRTMDLLAAGDVHFGYNVSETAWDGRDEFGDQVANGVYLYKAVIKFRDRSDHKVREEGIDDFFNNGYGKMYLFR